MNKIYIYIFLFAFTFSACETKTSNKIKEYDGKFKDADAVFLSMSKEYTLSLDGSQEYIYRQKLRLQSPASFNSMYGDSHIFYDPNYQECNVLLAETVNSMEKVISGKNAINDILPSNAKHSAYYNRLREKVVSHLGTEVGAVVNFDYIIKSNKDRKPALFEKIIIPASSPIRDFKIVVKLPESVNLKFYLFGSSIKPIISQEDNCRIFTWVFKDLPAMKHQSGEPVFRNDVPCLIFSTTKDDSLQHFLSASKLNDSDTSFFKPIVESVKKTLKKGDKLFLKLQDEVIDNIAFSNVSFSNASYRARSPKTVWTDASGNMIEKCFLLSELLKTAGYESEVLAAYPEQLINNSKSNPDFWTNCYVSAKMGDQSYLLSVIKKNTYDSSLDINGFRLYGVMSGKEYKYSSEKNIIKLEGTINMFSRTNIKSNLNLVVGGKYAYKFMKNGFLKSNINNCYKILPKKDTSRVCMIADAVSTDNNVAKLFSYDLPVYKGGFSINRLPILLADRRAPLNINNTVDECYDYKLRVGKWYRPIDKDTTISIKNSVGELLISTNTILKSRYIISYKRHLKLNKQIISVEDYKKFKELMDVWSDNRYKRLFFAFRKHVAAKRRVVRGPSMMRSLDNKKLNVGIELKKSNDAVIL